MAAAAAEVNSQATEAREASASEPTPSAPQAVASPTPAEIARHHVNSLPRTLRVLLRTMGAMNTGGGQLMSYLLFQDTYTRELIALGYHDAMKRADDLMSFLAGYTVASTGATAILRRVDSRKEQRAEAQK